MEQGFILGLMVNNMKGNGRMTNEMVKEFLNGLMDNNTMVILKITKEMVMEC